MAEINIPGYRIIKEIGHGGMSTVYLAEREALDQLVALKVMAPELAANRSFGERFMREGKTVGKLGHSGVLTIFDIGVSGHYYYMALEYVAGGDLKKRIRKGALDGTLSLKILEQVAAALGFAHNKGFIHRDVKPENILFRENGTVVISDFGIAKAVGSGSSLTGTGMTIGTPHYMSPEQAKGAAVDHRTDLYSLGVVFYEMLTGRVLYEAENSIAIAFAHVHNPIPDLPEALGIYQPFLNQLLAKEPSDRFATAEVMIAAIKELRGEVPAEMRLDENEAPQVGEPEQPLPVESQAETRTIHVVADTEIMPKLKDQSPSKTMAIPSGVHERVAEKAPPLTSVESTAKKTRLLLCALMVVLLISGVAFLQFSSETEPVVPPGQDVSVAAQKTGEPLSAGQKEAGDGVDSEEPVSNEPMDKALSKEQQVAKLLTLAGQDLQRNRLTSPKGGSAFDRYKAVLELDPQNKAAKEGIVRIGESYLALFDKRLKDANFELAETYLAKAGGLLGDTEEVRNRQQLLAEARKPEAATVQAQPVPLHSQPQASGREGTYELWIAKGQAALIKKDKPFAAEACGKALALKPNDPVAQQCLEQANQNYRGGEVFSDQMSTGKRAPEMVVIPKGNFLMGDTQQRGGSDERPVHKVVFSKPFAMSRTEVTLGVYDQFCRATKRPLVSAKGPTREKLPVSDIAWEDAVAFTVWLSKETRQVYRLPSEAEWEYAARGGSSTLFWWGNDLGVNRANCDGCGSQWDNQEPAPVGSFMANAYQLYDVTGNVWEWCSDDYHQSYEGAPKDGKSWIGSGAQKVYRGGSFLFGMKGQRVSFRNYGNKKYKSKDLGFRVVREL